MVNWFTPSDINEYGSIISSSSRKLSKSVLEKENIKLFPAKSLVYVGIGATAGKVGYILQEGYSNQQITALIPRNKADSKYYYYLLNISSKRIRENAFFTTLPIINNAYLSIQLIAYPPLSEQRQISAYLDEKCITIDALISVKQQKIESLKEYKKSLIFECVTGKRKID